MLVAGTLVAFPGESPTDAGPSGPIVNTVDDANNGPCDATHCSLREAILNLEPSQTITFDIEGAGPHVIKPLTVLPSIVDSGVTIDGYSQSGSAPNTAAPFEPVNSDIEIVLDGDLVTGTEFHGLWVGAQNMTIRGLAIVNFPDEGIRFGTFPSAAIQGNYVGVMPDGTTAGPNAIGIYLRSSQPGNIIGGSLPAHRNVISGNSDHGLDVSNTTAVVISGNFIGTTASGSQALPNGGYGINFAGGPGSTIGGGTLAAGNLISGNAGSGIALTTSDARNINLKGNRIGTTADGQSSLPNQEHGVYLSQDANNNTIGGEFIVGEQNIIAFNDDAGVALSASAGVNNYIDPSATHSNGGLGTDLLADGNVLPNDNGTPGEGCPPSDPTPPLGPDCDTGPNSLMNYPVISAASYDGGTLHVAASLTSQQKSYNIFVFLNDECDPSGFGEGQRFLSPSIGVQILTPGARAFSRDYNAVNIGNARYVTMSASDPESTSEFSQCREIDFPGGTPTPTPSPSPTTFAIADPDSFAYTDNDANSYRFANG